MHAFCQAKTRGPAHCARGSTQPTPTRESLGPPDPRTRGRARSSSAASKFSVRLSSVPIVGVRHGWGGHPDCGLYDVAGGPHNHTALPAGPCCSVEEGLLPAEAALVTATTAGLSARKWVVTWIGGSADGDELGDGVGPTDGAARRLVRTQNSGLLSDCTAAECPAPRALVCPLAPSSEGHIHVASNTRHDGRQGHTKTANKVAPGQQGLAHAIIIIIRGFVAEQKSNRQGECM